MRSSTLTIIKYVELKMKQCTKHGAIDIDYVFQGSHRCQHQRTKTGQSGRKSVNSGSLVFSHNQGALLVLWNIVWTLHGFQNQNFQNQN